MLAGLENPLHLVVVLLIVLIVFGAKRLPEMGRSLGSGMREFKTAILGNDAAELSDRNAINTDAAIPQAEAPREERDRSVATTKTE